MKKLWQAIYNWFTAPASCEMCGRNDHYVRCDSPGAMLTGTTGCPVHDASIKNSRKLGVSLMRYP